MKISVTLGNGHEDTLGPAGQNTLNVNSANQTHPSLQLRGCVLSASADQALVPGVQPTRKEVREHPSGGRAPAQHCPARPRSGSRAAHRPGTGGSFPCSPTAMRNTYCHRSEAAGSQTRTSNRSPTSSPTPNTNWVSKQKKGPKESTTDSVPYPNLLPHPTRRSSLCSG